MQIPAGEEETTTAPATNAGETAAAALVDVSLGEPAHGDASLKDDDVDEDIPIHEPETSLVRVCCLLVCACG